ncbi:hypothetical protein SO802_013737 [Lithocarpus litseifolius]|uniref:Uncharacterized protein n=1 Tax=Lithocarpus litseifolius TaxID=425828 RepID=A0AAW2D750_9ROSI
MEIGSKIDKSLKLTFQNMVFIGDDTFELKSSWMSRENSSERRKSASKKMNQETNKSHPSKTKQPEKENLQKPDIATIKSNPSTVGLKIQTLEVDDQQATLTSNHHPGETKKVSEDLGKVDNHQDLAIAHRLANEITNNGPTAMIYDCEVGWALEALGPNSAYWKGINRNKTTDGPTMKFDPIGNKRPGPYPL